MVAPVPIVTQKEMYRAEQAVIRSGTPGFELMRRAGRGVADAISARYPTGRINVLCGSGGNGGDGFVAATLLAERGWTVRVFLFGDVGRLEGDPAQAASLWSGPVEPIEAALSANADLTLDALFGAGLSRPLSGQLADLAQSQAGPVVSIDVPSGVDGHSAKPLGVCFTADLTVSFAAYRPTHILSPGRAYCGEVVLVDIGVPVDDSVIALKLAPDVSPDAICVENDAALETLCAGYNFAPKNRIEAITMLAQASGREIFLRAPDLILADRGSQVTVFIV